MNGREQGQKGRKIKLDKKQNFGRRKKEALNEETKAQNLS